MPKRSGTSAVGGAVGASSTTSGALSGGLILAAVRVLTVGNIYPPHHFGGYEQVWQSAVEHLRSGGHEVRVLCTGYRHPGVPDGDEPYDHHAYPCYDEHWLAADPAHPQRAALTERMRELGLFRIASGR